MARNNLHARESIWNTLIVIFKFIIVLALVYDLYRLYQSLFDSNKLGFIELTILTAALWLVLWYAVYYAILALWIFRETHRFFGQVSSEIREQMSILTSISRMNRTTYGGGLLVVYAGIIGLVAFFVFLNFRLLFIVLLAVAVKIWLYFRTKMPPFIVYLSSSDPQSISKHWNFKRYVSPLRVVTLLDVDSSTTHTADELHLDCLRTTNDDDWWEVILMLLHFSPLIIIDTNAITTGVLREADHILANSLTYKCIFLTSREGDSNLLSKVGLSSDKIEDLCTLNEGDTLKVIDRILSQVVLPSRETPLIRM